MAVVILVWLLVMWPVRWGGLFQWTVVSGQSMQPTFASGDLLLSFRRDEYRVGDVVVYHPATLDCGRCNVVHRIIGVDAGRYRTQGDNVPTADHWQPAGGDILGAVEARVPLGPVTTLLLSVRLWTTLSLLVAAVWLADAFRTAIHRPPESTSLSGPPAMP